MTLETILQGKDFSLLSKDNGVFLLRKGSPSSKKILKALREHLPACEVNVKALLLALKNETTYPVRIGTFTSFQEARASLPRAQQTPEHSPRQEEQQTARKKHISPATLDISPDGMICSLSLPAGWSSLQHILVLCAERGIVHGLRLSAVQEALKRSRSGLPVQHFPIAFGTPPLAGRDGALALEIPRPEGRPIPGDRGKIESYLLYSIVPVRENERVATLLDPTPGTVGKTVRGEPVLPRQGRKAIGYVGKGLVFRGRELVATRDGCLLWKGGVLSVEPLYIVTGDVEPGQSLTTDAHLLVEGHVRDGAVVEARGNVEIRGSVGRADVSSLEGSVSILWGILGKGGGYIRAAEEIRAGYVDEAILEARTVVVNEYISRSIVTARNGVKVAGKKGLIAASSVTAKAHVNVNNIRVLSRGDTRIDLLGVSRRALFSEYDLLPHRIRCLQRKLLRTSETIRNSLETTHQTHPELPFDMYRSLLHVLGETQARLLELHDLLLHLRGDASLSVTGTASPGVEVTIKGIATRIDKAWGGLHVFYHPVFQGLVVQEQSA
jgi:hypothetical protein